MLNVAPTIRLPWMTRYVYVCVVMKVQHTCMHTTVLGDAKSIRFQIQNYPRRSESLHFESRYTELFEDYMYIYMYMYMYMHLG